MSSTTDLKLNRSYNFSTIAPNVLEASFQNMKVIAIITAEEARKHQDIYTLHETIKRTVVNVILPTSADDCTFIVFETPTKEQKILALEYLESIEEVVSTSLVITVNNYTSSSYSVIKEALEGLGFRNISFKLTNTPVS